MRSTGDYDDFIDFTQVDVLDAFDPAKGLVAKIEKLVQ